MLSQAIEVDSSFSKEMLAGLCKDKSVAFATHVAMLLETVKRKYTQLACKVVVAHTCFPQRRLAGARSNADGAGPIRDAHQAFEQMRHVAIGESKVSMPSLVFHDNQSCVQQLRQVRADRLLCQVGDAGQLGGG